MQGSMSHSNSVCSLFLMSAPRAGGRVCSHESRSGRHPTCPGSTYTMPHRDTVAGDATARSATSKIMFWCTEGRVRKPTRRSNTAATVHQLHQHYQNAT
jgi:hypothetical protein